MCGCGVGFLCGPGFMPAVLVGVGVGVRAYVENLTVDASIFVVLFCFVVFLFDKLLRAIGGCLGTKSR